jgi:plastocyanin
MRMLLALPLAAFLIGCGSAHHSGSAHPPGRAQHPATATVTIRDFKFGAALHVSTGTKVVWVNADSAPHTATGKGFDTGTLAQGKRGSFTFTKPGRYSYVCQFHPFMHGTVVVR